jgi:signal transduction histidine kinase
MNLLLFVEIVGISFLMLVTGGFESPFIWCFLNPLLIVSYYLKAKLKIVYLSLNLLLLCSIGLYVEKNHNLGKYLLDNSNSIMSFILILILINFLFFYSRQIEKKQKELEGANNELESYNARISGMTQDILFLYEAVQTIPGQRGYYEIVNIILNYAGRLSPEYNAFFIQRDIRRGDGPMSLKPMEAETMTQLLNKLQEENGILPAKRVTSIKLAPDMTAVYIHVANNRDYGIIGFLVPETDYCKETDRYEANLLLLSQLCTTFFEKIDYETVGYELAVADEQNRIADDIHDSVIQRLFAASCFAYDTIKKWDKITDESKKEQMAQLMESIQTSLTDLRSTIYNLSYKKQQIVLFVDSIRSYLEELERLSGIKIHLEVEGNTDEISLSARKAIYRIIAETTGNAMKYARCSNIWITIDIGNSNTILKIRDDGIGFDVQKAEMEKKGLGLNNIKSLVRILGGNVNIKSSNTSGTAYSIEFPDSSIARKPGLE